MPRVIFITVLRAGVVLILASLAIRTGLGEPHVAPGGVLNAAGLTPPALPGSAVARGSLITILGSELGPGAGVAWDGVQLRSELAGVSVAVIDSRGLRYAATPLFVRSDRINAVMPCEIAPGPARVIVTVAGRSGSPSEPFQAVERNFQVFTRNRNGWGPALAESVSEAGPVLNSLTSPAARGQTVSLSGTGMGACGGAGASTGPVERSEEIQVVIGNQPARVIGYKPAPGFPGVEQILAVIPASAPEGCYVPMVVRARHQYSNFTSISIATPGKTCSDTLNGYTLLTEPLKVGPISWGRIQLLHGTAITELPGFTRLETSSEFGEAAFLRSSPDDLDRTFHYPSLGACLVMPLGSVTTVPGRAGASLNAGDLNLRGPWGLRFLRDPADGIYRRRLNPTPFEGRSGDFIRPNSRYLVSGQAGPEVGALHASAGIPAFIQWTNRDRLPFVLQRTTPVVITWAGGDPGREFVVIRGYSLDRDRNVGRDFVCTAPVEPRTFTLPVSVLSKLPDSERDMFISIGNTRYLAAPSFVTRGLQMGFFDYEIATGRNFGLE